MNQEKELYRIEELLSRFSEQISIANKNEEFSSNNHAELFLIKLFKLVFDSSHLKKLNKNFPGIDLGDDKKRIAFQITSTSNITKIKNTLDQFIDKQLFIKYDTLFIFIISKKQDNYNQTVIDKQIIKSTNAINRKNPQKEFKKIYFNVKKHIIDKVDLYELIKVRNDLKKIIEIKELLEEQFADYKNEKSFKEQTHQFIEEYKRIVLNDFSRINFFGLDIPKKPREIELYSLFVEPNFKYYKENNTLSGFDNNFLTVGIDLNNKFYKTEFLEITAKSLETANFEKIRIQINNSDTKLNEMYLDKHIDYNHIFKTNKFTYRELFNSKRNTVIIGNPGAGKSLLIKHAICKILSKDKNQFETTRIEGAIPFRIELYKFNKDRNGKGIEDYIIAILSNYSIKSISQELIENILKNNITIVFFDGLDEIFDIQERVEVRNIIENFTKKYEKSSSIVTSRFESYEEVGLSSKLFKEIEILDFEESQIIDYVNKWYSIEELDAFKRKEEVANCIEQLKRVDNELKKSPLLLSLILILYRNELDIPTTKLEIYESCTNTLIKTRDTKEKKLVLNLKITNIEEAFAHIAYWQFNLQNHITQKKEINYKSVLIELVRFLTNQKNTSFEEISANIAAKEFLEYAKIRSIYVENSFTHKSFLEYFTAYYIYSNYYYKGDHQFINQIFTNNIDKSAWFVVLELLICKIDNGQPDTDIIDKIIDIQINKNGIIAILFFTQIINQLQNISPFKENQIISNAIKYIIESRNDMSLLLFNHLIHLGSNHKNKLLVSKQFDAIINEISEDNHLLTSYYIFKLEFEILLGNLNVYSNKFNINDNSYLFILENYPLLFDGINYFEFLKIFIEKFGKLELYKNFSSYSNSKIFFGSSNFNWITSCLFVSIDIKQFLRNFRKLKSLGFENAEIIKIIKKSKTGVEISQSLLNNYYSNTTDYSIRSFLNQISIKFHSKSCEESINNSNYNQGLSRQKKNRHY